MTGPNCVPIRPQHDSARMSVSPEHPIPILENECEGQAGKMRTLFTAMETRNR